MKTNRHRCVVCGKISSRVSRDIDSGGLSSEWVWVCRKGYGCGRPTAVKKGYRPYGKRAPSPSSSELRLRNIAANALAAADFMKGHVMKPEFRREMNKGTQEIDALVSVLCERVTGEK